MSGIYIPDVGLPETNDAYCLFLSRDGTVHLWRGPHAMVGHEFKAILVPDHGRLVCDREVKWAFDDAIMNEAQQTGKVRATSDEIAKIISSVPTIIPTEEGS